MTITAATIMAWQAAAHSQTYLRPRGPLGAIHRKLQKDLRRAVDRHAAGRWFGVGDKFAKGGV